MTSTRKTEPDGAAIVVWWSVRRALVGLVVLVVLTVGETMLAALFGGFGEAGGLVSAYGALVLWVVMMTPLALLAGVLVGLVEWALLRRSAPRVAFTALVTGLVAAGTVLAAAAWFDPSGDIEAAAGLLVGVVVAGVVALGVVRDARRLASDPDPVTVPA